MRTTIKPCNCKNEFQDKTYGRGNRVHNLSERGTEAKCTVCGDKKKV